MVRNSLMGRTIVIDTFIAAVVRSMDTSVTTIVIFAREVVSLAT
jgi:hypothetical protein